MNSFLHVGSIPLLACIDVITYWMFAYTDFQLWYVFLLYDISTQNNLISCSWNCEVDHPSLSTVVNLGEKQMLCSLRCLWSQVQKDTSGRDYFRILGCLWTVHHQCTCKWDAKCFFPVESKDCMKSASYESRKMSARRGAQIVPIWMPTVCWKTFPAKITKILSTRNSSILMMSSSESFLTKL